MFVATKDLPATLKDALFALGFNRADIAVTAKETFSAALCANDGCRGFVCLVNLATGERMSEKGSWGGANPFEARIVDSDDSTRPLPVGFAVILGYEGGGRPVSAGVSVHPQTMAPGLLPAPTEALPAKQLAALCAVRETKGGTYRVERFDREGLGKYGPQNEHVAALVSAGLLKATAAGAISVTTAGKNVPRK